MADIGNLWSKLKDLNYNSYLENKSAYVTIKCVKALIFIFFSVLFISLVFFNNGAFVDIRGQLIMTLISFCVFVLLYQVINVFYMIFRKSEISFTSSLIFMFLGIFILQLYFVLSIYTTSGWDAGLIIKLAKGEGDGIEQLYLSVFSNNILIFFIFRLFFSIFRLIGLSDYWLGLSVLNIILVDLSLLCSIITLRKLHLPIYAYYNLIVLFVLLVGFSPWLVVPYSDTLSMPIVSALVLFCILAIQSKTAKKRLVYSVICGVIFALGWLVKSTIIAVIAALFITLLLHKLHMRKLVNIRCAVVPIASGILSFTAILILFNLFVDNQRIIHIDRSLRTPMSYSIATGLVELQYTDTRSMYGVYDEELAYLNRGTTQEKNVIYYRFIREKLQDFGMSGYLEYLFNKARWITSEGDFHWYREGGGDADFSNPDKNILRSFLYITGEHYDFWRHAVNGLWIVVFFGCCLGMLISLLKCDRVKNKRFDAELFFTLIFLFIILVLLVVEARTRYLISFLPVICMISAIGYSSIVNLYRSYREVH